MKLRETIDRIIQKKSWAQKDVAAYMGVDPSSLSNLGSQWEAHWEAFMKLLPLCIELDLITERDLLCRKRDPKNTQSNLTAGAIKVG